MTWVEELEALRGCSIPLLSGDPKDIPCIETSDEEKLCKNPVVSVHMVAYNHGPYICQAIEGVLKQKTDFEFELVIGEDCSTDNTREICFEYQKKHPDKIRVLWWHENMRKVNHPAGANAVRVTARCRGEFIAYCEGDDYWIDSYKLQKQVDLLRRHANAGMCFCGASTFNQSSGVLVDLKLPELPEVISGRQFVLWRTVGVTAASNSGNGFCIMTATVMLRRTVAEESERRFAINQTRIRTLDSCMWFSVAGLSDVCYLKDNVAVYRIVNTGSMGETGWQVYVNAMTVRMFFLDALFGVTIRKSAELMSDLLFRAFVHFNWRLPGKEQKKRIRNLRRFVGAYSVLSRGDNLMVFLFASLGLLNRYTRKFLTLTVFHADNPSRGHYFKQLPEYRDLLKIVERHK